MPDVSTVPPVDWGSLAMGTPPSHNPVMSRITGNAWTLIVRIVAWIVAVFALAGGIVLYSEVSDLTSLLNGGWFRRGQPNTGMAVIVMLGTWVCGFASTAALIVLANAADDIRQIRNSADRNL